MGFSYPVVAKGMLGFSMQVSLVMSIALGEARIRVQLSAIHEREHIDRCIDAFIDVGRSKGVI